jgi:hypothetical protein
MDQITNYTSLKAAAVGMTHRTGDTAFEANLPLFVQLCEARLSDMMLLRESESDEPLTLVVGNNYVALPAGYVSPLQFWLVIDGQRTVLTPALPQQLPYNTENSCPNLWAIDGENIRFDCPADTAYSAYLRCIKSFNLSDSVTTNYLLERRPDIYLAGTMAEIARFARDEGLFSTWEAVFVRGTNALKAAESRNRGIAPLRTDIALRSRSNILTGQ